MARQRGIWGVEAGDQSGCAMLGATVATGSKRSGTYGMNAKATVAFVNGGAVISHPTISPSGGQLFNYMDRQYFRPVTLPSANDLIIGTYGGLRLEMNTSGQLRQNGTGAFGSASSYGAAVTLGDWYYVEFRVWGYRHTGTVKPYRTRGSVAVYSVGASGIAAPSLLTSWELPNAPVQNFADLNTAKIGSCATEPNDTAKLNPPGGWDFDKLAAEFAGYDVSLVASSNVPSAVGAGWTVFSAGEMRKFIGCTFENGAGEDVFFTEIGGTLWGLSLSYFYPSVSLEVPTVKVGQTGGVGAGCTREIDYDDVIWDQGTGADAAAVGINSAVRILPFPVIAQGGFDQFAVAGHFADVAEIPRNNAASVSSAGAGNKTTYQHSALGTDDVVQHIRCYVNGNSGTFTHNILIGATSYPTLFTILTDASDSNTARADQIPASPMDAATFDALEFGVEVGSGGGTLLVKNILLEVLTGPAVPTADAGIDQTIALSEATLAGATTPSVATHTWSVVSGPNTPTIADPTALTTIVSGLLPGVYVFRLTAVNGTYTVTDDVTITVTLGPEVTFTNGVDTVGLTWVELTDKASGLHVWAKVALPDPAGYYGGFKDGIVTHWGVISRALSDRDGQFEGTQFSWTVSDVTRAVRGLLADPLTRYFPNLALVVRMIADIDRRALATPRTILKAILTGYQPQGSLLFDFRAEDQLTHKFSAATGQNQVPSRTITVADFPECGGSKFVQEQNGQETTPQEIPIGANLLPVPIIYGQVTDRNVQTLIVQNTALPFDASIAKVPGCFANGVADGLGSFADNERVGFVVTAVKAGSEGPFPIYFGINMGGALQGDSVIVNFDGTADADSYRIYLYDGVAFDPHGDHFNSVRVRVLTHDNVTMDGAYGAQFSVTFHSFADGTDALTGSTTITQDSGKGQVPVIYVGQKTIGGTPYHQFLVAGHACKAIEDIYIAGRALDIQGGTTGPLPPVAGPTVVAPGGDWLVPGYSGWTAAIHAAPYEDINGHRYCSIYGKVGAANPDKAAGVVPLDDSNAVPMAVNVQGIETVGDGSGTLITDILLQYRHAMQNWVLGSYETGAWLTTPVFSDDALVAKMDDASFSSCSAQAALRVPGGYVGAFILGAPGTGAMALRDLVARFNICGDVNSGFNRNNQFFVSMVPDDLSAMAAAPVFTDDHDIFSDTFTIDDLIDDWFNQLPYVHSRDHFGRSVNKDHASAPTAGVASGGPRVGIPTNGWLFPAASSDENAGLIQDLVSIAGFGQEKKAQTVELTFIRGQNAADDPAVLAQGTATADDVMQRRLIRVAEPPRQVTFSTGLRGLSVELGDVILITHYGGIGTDGWTERPCRVVRHEIDPDQFLVTLVAVDLGRLFETGTFLGDEGTLPAAHGDATDTERRYLYLCDETTGLFGDSSPGQRLR